MNFSVVDDSKYARQGIAKFLERLDHTVSRVKDVLIELTTLDKSKSIIEAITSEHG